MIADDFADRVAALEEHVDSRPLTSEQWLELAEKDHAHGFEDAARNALFMAKLVRGREERESDT